VDGGWESLTATLLTGVCRKVFPWTDNSGVTNIAFGTHSNLHLWQGGVLYDITPYGPPTPLGSNPFSVTNASATVTVTQTAHGRSTGDKVHISGATAVATVTINGTWTITVVDANTYTFVAGSNANATTTGGGSAAVATPQVLLPAGAIDGTGSIGYGTGAFGVGPWGQTSLTTDYFPRTWSLDAWGQQLVASPRNGGLYAWANNTANRAVAVDGAPVRITNMLVAPMQGGYMLFALGCNQEADGVFNPRNLRHSAIRDYTTWSTTTSTSREYTLPGVGDIVAGRMCGPHILVWTTHELFLGVYTGDLALPWNFQQVGKNCGLIGPNAATVKGQTAYWVSPDRQFYSYMVGDEPRVIPCPIRTGFADNLAASQGDKVVASTNSEFEEIRFDYPDARDAPGYENSRFIRVSVSQTDPGAWSQGIQARTAFVDAAGASARYPIGVTYAGNAYYHEKGNTADGAPFAWSIKSAAQLLDVDWRMLIKSIWPDFQGQIGPVYITISSLEHPQGTPVVLMSGAIAPATERVDLLITGRFFQVEISGNSSPTWMRIGKPVVEVERAGKAV
jgi:hypothetical protein